MKKYFFFTVCLLILFSVYSQNSLHNSIILRTENNVEIYNVDTKISTPILSLVKYNNAKEQVIKMSTTYKENLLFVDLSIKEKKRNKRNDIYVFKNGENIENIEKIQINSYQEIQLPPTSKYNAGFIKTIREGVKSIVGDEKAIPYLDTITTPIGGSSYDCSNIIDGIFYVTNGGLFKVKNGQEDLVIPHKFRKNRRPKIAEGYLSPNLSFDGEKVVFTDGYRILLMLSTETKKVDELIGANSIEYRSEIINPMLSANSEWILFRNSDSFYLFSMKEKKVYPFSKCMDAIWIK